MANGNLNRLAENIAEATVVYVGNLTRAGKLSGAAVEAMAERFAGYLMEGFLRDNTFDAPPVPKIAASPDTARGYQTKLGPVGYATPESIDQDYIIHVTRREKDEQK